MLARQISPKNQIFRLVAAAAAAAATAAFAPPAGAVSSAELYTTAAYQYGRFEARVQYAAGDGVVSSFFLWKVGSEQAGVYWNELDFEKLWADCSLATNALHGAPEMSHSEDYTDDDLCDAFHTYAYEWTPDYIAWFIDDVEIRRETGEHVAAFRDNAASGMRIHFNVWPGDATFGGNFDPAILPVHQYINWVQYSSYEGGDFVFQWREDFDGGSLPGGWQTGNWPSPKNLSTHSSANVSFIDGFVVLSLTADGATGPSGANPVDNGPSQPDPDPTDDGTTDDDPPVDDGQPTIDAGVPPSADDSPAPDDTGTDDTETDDEADDATDGAGGGPSNDDAPADMDDAEPGAGAGGTPNDTNSDDVDTAPSGSGAPTTTGDAEPNQPPTNPGGSSSSAPSSTSPSPTSSGTTPTSDSPVEPVQTMAQSDSEDAGGGCAIAPRSSPQQWVWGAFALGALLFRRKRTRRQTVPNRTE